MRFKTKRVQQESSEINLVPMMDVLMTILVFFIIISMTAQFSEQAVDVKLPAAAAGGDTVNQPDPLVVQLDSQSQIFIGEELLDKARMAQQIQQYLATNPEGIVVLKADYTLTYQQIIEVLGPMRDVGGSQVSLAIEQQ
jgi:biopolymer transport protein ExbD